MQWLRCYCLCLLLPFHALRAEPLQLVDTLASLQPRAGQTPQAGAQILQLILQQYPSPYTLVDISRNRARMDQNRRQCLYSLAAQNAGTGP